MIGICSISILVSLLTGEHVVAASLETLQILKISPQDERAVIKTPDGKMHVIKLGDAVGDSGKVMEIAKDRVVIEERSEKGQETIVFRLEDGKQRVERIKKSPERKPQLYAVPDTKAEKGNERPQSQGKKRNSVNN